MMRFSIAALGIALASVAFPAPAQQTTLRRLENEMLARIGERAVSNSGFRLDSSEFDLRLPIRGEPEEVFGPTMHAAEALAIGSARLEPLDTITSRDTTFSHARYELRLEDRAGNCIVVHQDVTFDSKLVKERRTSERCQPLYMAEVLRRARRIARLPFSAGRLDDHWSAALSATGTVDVYLDSVVVRTTGIALRASYPSPAEGKVVVDSISAGLAMGESSWSVVRKSMPIPVDTTLRKDGEWRRTVKRFVIPIDSTLDLKKSWPMFEVYLSVPKTADNPHGIAWTYAHEQRGFFVRVLGRSAAGHVSREF
jgi:hypothetical protein